VFGKLNTVRPNLVALKRKEKKSRAARKFAGRLSKDLKANASG
jgi:hypothetical protein